MHDLGLLFEKWFTKKFHTVEFDNLRLLAYPESDLFVVCFSVVNPESLQNVKRLWLHEIQEKGQAFTRAACLLVGTKNDLRQDERTLNDLQSINQQPVSFEEAEQFAKENGFYAYRECSALTRDGIEEVIMTGIEACLAQKREQKDTAVKNSAVKMESSVKTTETTTAVEKVVEKGEEKKEQEPQPPLFMIPFMFVMSVLGKCEIL